MQIEFLSVSVELYPKICLTGAYLETLHLSVITFQRLLIAIVSRGFLSPAKLLPFEATGNFQCAEELAGAMFEPLAQQPCATFYFPIIARILILDLVMLAFRHWRAKSMTLRWFPDWRSFRPTKFMTVFYKVGLRLPQALTLPSLVVPWLPFTKNKAWHITSDIAFS